MLTFRYTATDQMGKRTRGRIAADSTIAAGIKLEQQGLVPMRLTPAHAFADEWRTRQGGVRWRIEDKILFTRKFASLVKAGIPLLKTLDLIAQQTKAPRTAAALRSVGDSVANGKSLHDALAAFPALFDPIYLGTIRTGEATGQLDTVLEHTASFLEREMATRRKVKEALRYPIMVVVAIVVASTVILKFVVPRFLSFYTSFGSDLPAPTRLLLGASDLVNRSWWLFLPGLAVGWAVWRWWTKTPSGRAWRDRFLLRLPLVGPLVLKVAVSQFTRLFGLLYSAGLPATTALKTTIDGIGNAVVADEVSAMCDRLSVGGPIAERPPNSVMPELVYQMIDIGFESGEVDRMLVEVARHYEQEIDYDVRRLTDRLQPILLLFLAAGVLILALAVLLPMWNLISVFRS